MCGLCDSSNSYSSKSWKVSEGDENKDEIQINNFSIKKLSPHSEEQELPSNSSQFFFPENTYEMSLQIKREINNINKKLDSIMATNNFIKKKIDIMSKKANII